MLCFIIKIWKSTEVPHSYIELAYCSSCAHWGGDFGFERPGSIELKQLSNQTVHLCVFSIAKVPTVTSGNPLALVNIIVASYCEVFIFHKTDKKLMFLIFCYKQGTKQSTMKFLTGFLFLVSLFKATPGTTTTTPSTTTSIAPTTTTTTTIKGIYNYYSVWYYVAWQFYG